MNANKTAELLRGMDNVLILTHQSPDGDTLGSGYGLCYALRSLGKSANVVCADPIPERYSYFTQHYVPQDFEPQNIVAVDVADTKLLGSLESYADNVVLCIDHHGTNKEYAKNICLDATAASTTELLYEILAAMEVEFTPLLADCIYTGLTTDTGCFKYTNTTAKTHITAAKMIEYGAQSGKINLIMFDTKTRERVAIEKAVYNNIEFYHSDRCALICVTQNMLKETGAGEEELEGVSAMPRQIAGVQVGVTMREKEDGAFKISIRTSEDVDASEICAHFGGGGHKRAAGCRIELPLKQARDALIEEIAKHLV